MSVQAFPFSRILRTEYSNFPIQYKIIHHKGKIKLHVDRWYQQKLCTRQRMWKKTGGVRAFNKIAKLSFLQMGLEVMIYTFLNRDKHINKKLRKCSQCQMRSHLNICLTIPTHNSLYLMMRYRLTFIVIIPNLLW